MRNDHQPTIVFSPTTTGGDGNAFPPRCFLTQRKRFDWI